MNATFEALNGYSMEFTEFGKPSAATFEYAERHIARHWGAGVKRFYMIGDNLDTDIKGANQMGSAWTSIATLSGVFQGTEEEMETSKVRPDHIVKDFKQAVELILELEKKME